MAYVPQEYPPSRPGIKTLFVVVGMVVLFIAYTFWAELTSLVGAGAVA
ncbi:MAG: hypothetical protein ACM30I_11895 [Gemmatimonas sp.]